MTTARRRIHSPRPRRSASPARRVRSAVSKLPPQGQSSEGELPPPPPTVPPPGEQRSGSGTSRLTRTQMVAQSRWCRAQRMTVVTQLCGPTGLPLAARSLRQRRRCRSLLRLGRLRVAEHLAGRACSLRSGLPGVASRSHIETSFVGCGGSNPTPDEADCGSHTEQRTSRGVVLNEAVASCEAAASSLPGSGDPLPSSVTEAERSGGPTRGALPTLSGRPLADSSGFESRRIAGAGAGRGRVGA